jgi:hypothetical protein
MARPHIEFLQSQRLSWDDPKPGVTPPGRLAKVLSFDPVTSESSQLVKIAAGSSRIIDEYLPVDEEFFVLNGDLMINDTAFSPHNYAFLPAGFPRKAMRSDQGAELLVFYSGAPDPIPGATPQGAYDESRLISRLDPFEMVWDRSGQDPGIADLQAWRKILRLDPAGKCRTFLLAGLPQGIHPAREKPMEWHSYCEEAFLIAGDLPCHCGVMKPGAYFWRPPEIDHGLECSLTGFLTFMRIPGSNENVNNWVQKGRVSLTPPHAPFLPPHLAHLGAEPLPDPIVF